MWWLTWRCAGSVRDVVPQWEMLRLSERCGSSVGDGVAQLEMWWLSEKYGSSVEDVVAQSCGGSVGESGSSVGAQ